MMDKRKACSALLVCLIFLGACTNKDAPAETPSRDAATLRTITQGKIIGTRGRDNAYAWYGIAYAAPPIGELRWRAPRPPALWEGVFEALDPTSRCPQIAMDNEPEAKSGDFVGDEDCLHLSVWAPSKPAPSAQQSLPVMFWIHGGGNVWGYAGQYEMGRLAQSQNVIVVSINYRLGPMGWFAHSAIRETAQSELDASANFGTLDIIAALDWVKNNIEAFGGDPDNITLFGESAGGFNVASLLASPMAKGKFHRAIIQSAGFGSTSLQMAEFGPVGSEPKRGTSSSEAIAKLAELSGVSVDSYSAEALAAFLRTQSAETLFKTYLATLDKPSLMGGIEATDIIEDGIVIPLEGVRAQLSKPGGIENMPIMMGTNRDEILGVSFLDKDMMNNIGILAYWPKDPDLYQAAGDYPDRIWRALGAEQPAGLLHAQGHRDVYTYRFDWDEQGRALFTNIGKLVGAHHALEIAFMTGGFDDQVNDKMGLSFKNNNRAGREELSSAMMSYWAHFAYTGTPDRGRNDDLPVWKAWSPETEKAKAMLLDTSKDQGIRMTTKTENYPDLVAAIDTDPALKTNEDRCRVALTSKFVITPMYKDYTRIDAAIEKYCAGLDIQNQ